jgi:hypothetical protein
LLRFVLTIVVLGCAFAYPSVTNFPLFALRADLPPLLAFAIFLTS